MATIHTPVLVVGAGPVGLTAARLLAQQGVACVVVERRDGPQRHPAAHVVNARSLEIFRQAGLDMDAIDAVAKDPADAGHVNFVTTLGGDLIGRLPFERQGADCNAITPTPLRNISQHRLEPILAGEAAADPAVDLRYEVQWQSSEQDDEGVTSTITDLRTGERHTVRSRYLLAADGAGSRVRKSLGIEMNGPPSLESFVAIHLAADLRSVVADRPGVLHFVMDPAASGAFVAHDIDREWVFMVGYDPETASVDDYDEARCRTIVDAAIGDAGPVAYDVLGAGAWHMSAQVAERMRSDRVFLVGDAAHRFPPTGGLGLNTGVADVHDLAWKIGAVEAGWAGPGLLDTYETERRPVAEHNCEQSTANAFKLLSLYEALGIVEDPTTAQLERTLADRAARPAIDAAVAEQATHFDMIGLQLGYRYTEGALVADEHAPPPPEHPSCFEPIAAVGERLPHAWTTDGRSTLDLVDPSALTLISVGGHDAWSDAVAAAETIGVPVRHVRIGVDADLDVPWQETGRLAADAALLVRPDHHIAWRATATTDAPLLGDAIRAVLDPPTPVPSTEPPHDLMRPEGDPMHVIDAAAARRQVKRFSTDPVDDVDIRAVLEAARRCSSGLNAQPWQFVVVRDPEGIGQLAETWPGAAWITAAPVVIAVLAATEPGGEFGPGTEYDIGQAVATITLAATGIGLASGQTACIDQDRARDVLGAPESVYCSSLIALGRPIRPLLPIDEPNRRPYDHIVHLDRWSPTDLDTGEPS